MNTDLNEIVLNTNERFHQLERQFSDSQQQIADTQAALRAQSEQLEKVLKMLGQLTPSTSESAPAERTARPDLEPEPSFVSRRSMLRQAALATLGAAAVFETMPSAKAGGQGDFILGTTNSTTNETILNYSSSGYALGVYNSGGGNGVEGGAYGSACSGVYGYNNSPGISSTAGGVTGSSMYGNGVYGASQSGSGVYGASSSAAGAGVKGTALGTGRGVRGVASSGSGVYGSSTSGAGTKGTSNSSYGVHGTSTSGVGVQGESTGNTGVVGKSTASSNFIGTYVTASGVYGSATGHGGAGVYGSGLYFGVYGVSGSPQGAVGATQSGYGVVGQGSRYGGSFSGALAPLFLFANKNGVSNPNSDTNTHLEGEVFVDNGGGLWYCVSQGVFRKLADFGTAGSLTLLPEPTRFVDTRTSVESPSSTGASAPPPGASVGTPYILSGANALTAYVPPGGGTAPTIPYGATAVVGRITVLNGLNGHSTVKGGLKLSSVNPPGFGSGLISWETTASVQATSFILPLDNTTTAGSGQIYALNSSSTDDIDILIDISGYYY